MSGGIEIRHDGHSRVVPADQVYFSFASGRLTYDCMTCQMNCCRRGLGYWVNTEAERLVQLTDRPSSRFFLERGPRPGYERMHNHPPGCFFLTDDGLCSIHADHGPSAKPLTCRLFPFNRVLLVDDHLIVGPKAGMCPLSPTPVGERSDLSEHDVILDIMASHGLDRAIVQGRGVNGDTRRMVQLERELVALSDHVFLGGGSLLGFVDAQTSTTRAGYPELTPSSSGRCGSAPTAREMMGYATALLGFDRDGLGDIHAEVRAAAIALAPSIRSAVLFYQAEGKNAWQGRLFSVDRAPFAVLGVAVLGELAKRAGMVTVTVQTLWSLFKDYRAVIWTLAHVDLIPAWRDDLAADRQFVAVQRGTRGGFGEVAGALLPVRQRQQPTRLVDILLACGRGADSMQRTRLLKLTSERIYGKVVV